MTTNQILKSISTDWTTTHYHSVESVKRMSESRVLRAFNEVLEARREESRLRFKLREFGVESVMLEEMEASNNFYKAMEKLKKEMNNE